MIQQSHLKLVNFSCHNLHPVNLEVQHNETISISGDSGAGKSLLLRAIADLIPHQGDYYLNTQHARDIIANEWRRQVAYFAAESQWWYDTIGEHFKKPLTRQMETYLKSIGFSLDVLNWEVMRCSTGERQRLAIIRLLVNEPAVLLLDEPTANLDTENTRQVEAIFKQYQQQSQCSIIWVSHNTEQKNRIADRQFQIKQAELIEIKA